VYTAGGRLLRRLVGEGSGPPLTKPVRGSLDEAMQKPGRGDRRHRGCEDRQWGGEAVGTEHREERVAQNRVNDVQRVADIGEEVGDRVVGPSVPNGPNDCEQEDDAEEG